MRKYMVSELWGGLMDEDKEFEAKDINDVKSQYLTKKSYTNHKVVYDSIKNHVESSNRVIAIQEGYYDKDVNTTYIRGKRYFYKIIEL